MTYLRTNYDVAHSFAHSICEEGRNGNYNFSFEKNVMGRKLIYSYRTAIGRKIEIKARRKDKYTGENRVLQIIFLLNQEKHSITTSTHQGILEGSVYGLIIKVCNEKSLTDWEEGVESYLSKLEYLVSKFKRARKYKTDRLKEIEKLCEYVYQYLMLFKKQIDFRTLPKSFKKILKGESVLDSNIIKELKEREKKQTKGSLKR